MNYLPFYDGALLFKEISNFSKTTKIHWNYLFKKFAYFALFWFSSKGKKRETKKNQKKIRKKRDTFLVSTFLVYLFNKQTQMG